MENEYLKVVGKIKRNEVSVLLGAFGYQENVDGDPISFLTRKIGEDLQSKCLDYLKYEQARIAQENAPVPPEIIVEVNE